MPRVVPARIIKLRKTDCKLLHGPPQWRNPIVRADVWPRRKPLLHVQKVKCDSPALPSLTAAERATLDALITAEKKRLKPAQDKAKDTLATTEAKKTGETFKVVRDRIELRLEKQLLPPQTLLMFDRLGTVTVAQVLADPDRFVNETLADPADGPESKPGKAKLFAMNATT